MNSRVNIYEMAHRTKYFVRLEMSLRSVIVSKHSSIIHAEYLMNYKQGKLLGSVMCSKISFVPIDKYLQ
jgi:hypothetical protein